MQDAVRVLFVQFIGDGLRRGKPEMGRVHGDGVLRVLRLYELSLGLKEERKRTYLNNRKYKHRAEDVVEGGVQCRLWATAHSRVPNLTVSVVLEVELAENV